MLTRRQILELSALAAGKLATGCTGEPARACDVRGDGAAATFEVDESSALVALWSRTADAARIELLDQAGARVAEQELTLDAESGAGTVELTGLAPATPYRYQVGFDDGDTLETFTFTTAPAADERAPVRLAIAADIDTDPQFDSPIFGALARTPADFLVTLGDWPYADNAPGAQTLLEYRARHAEARLDPRMQPVLRRMPVYAIYDDHEARNNWDGHFRVAEASRIEAALRVWDEFFPLRTARHRYRAWRWGALAEMFLLDTRLYRSANRDPDGPAKTMLGAEQKRWLIEAVSASTAAFKIVFTSVPLDFGSPEDNWTGFARERDEILAALAAAEVSGLLFVTADQHYYASYRHVSGARELQFGPLARGIPDLPPEREGILARYAGYNFGDIEITDTSGGPVLEIRCRDENGEALDTTSFRPDELRLTSS